MQVFEELGLITQNAKCGFVATSRKLAVLCAKEFSRKHLVITNQDWMRNLGHESPSRDRLKRRQAM